MSLTTNALVDAAIARLEASCPSLEVSREDVMAYAALLAYVQHWKPYQESSEFALLEKTKFIYDSEPARVVKQRRIYIAMLSKALRTF